MTLTKMFVILSDATYALSASEFAASRKHSAELHPECPKRQENACPDK